MIRLVNDMNGFSYFNTSNKDLFGVNTFPEQYNDYIDTYTTLKFKDVMHFNTYYRFKIQKKYSNYNSVITEDRPKIFRIVRFDNGKTDKAILIGNVSGEVIVAKASELLKLQNIDTKFCKSIKNKIEKNDNKYFEPVEPYDKDNLLAFFEKYNAETIWEYPVQDYNLLGRIVWIEYDSNLNSPKSSENIIHTTDPETGETVPVTNDFSFTTAMRNWIIRNNRKLEREPDYYLAYYPYTYNIHAQSRIDLPRRTTTQGVIVRADVQGTEPHIVVMEITGSNTVKFLCDDEARFYIDTSINNNGINFNAFTASSNYKPYGYIEEEEEIPEEEEPEEETTPEEEEEESSTPEYDDVIIHIKTDTEEEEEPEEESEDGESEEEDQQQDSDQDGDLPPDFSDYTDELYD